MLEKSFFYLPQEKKKIFSVINYLALVCSGNFCIHLDNEGQQHQTHRSARTPKHQSVTISAAAAAVRWQVCHTAWKSKEAWRRWSSFFPLSAISGSTQARWFFCAHLQKPFVSSLFPHIALPCRNAQEIPVHEWPNFTPGVQSRVCPAKALEKAISRTGIHVILTRHWALWQTVDVTELALPPLPMKA